MDYEIYETFETGMIDPQLSRPSIPLAAYLPVKRCPNCQSVYLTEARCEACGRSLLYHPIGEAFGAKSLYAIKERYYADFPLLVKYFPFFENKVSSAAKSYVKILTKRFDDLFLIFAETSIVEDKNKQFFYVEILELIDELLRYGIPAETLLKKIEEKSRVITPELLKELFGYIDESQKENSLSPPWKTQILKYRIYGPTLEFMLKILLAAFFLVSIALFAFKQIAA